MAKEIRWIKDGYYREECSGNWEPVFFNSPPDSERVKNIKQQIDQEVLTKDIERYLKLYASYGLRDC